MTLPSLVPLACGVQHYAWGQTASNGEPPFIADLLGIPAAPDQPFAELWIGAHPQLPAMARLGEKEDPQPLDRLVAEQAHECLGAAAVARGEHALPFLLKILSCRLPLSIQAHPDKRLAEELHRLDPRNYPDANHKPEIAIGLTGMRALCRFRPAPAIRADLETVPPLREAFCDLLPGTGDRAWIRDVYARTMTMTESEFELLLQAMADYLRHHDAPTDRDRLFLELLGHCPGDVGTLSAYYLNEIRIGPGQAVFIGANEPHAYLEGTIVECMANSNNVVRAGLTPKFTDTETLLRMLTYDAGAPTILNGEVLEQDALRRYEVPTDEFLVERWQLRAPREIHVHNHGLAALIVVTGGRARARSDNGATFSLGRGSTWFWPAAHECLHLIPEDGFTAFMARANPR